MGKLEGLKMKYFVLHPYKDNAYGHASRKAIKEYARQISNENPELTRDLDFWMQDIERDGRDDS